MTQYCHRLWQLLTRSYQNLWTPNARYRLHKSPQLQNTISQMNSLQVGTLRSILILFFHLFLVSQADSDCVVISNTFNKSMAVHNSHTLRLLVTVPYTLPVPTFFLWQLTALVAITTAEHFRASQNLATPPPVFKLAVTLGQLLLLLLLLLLLIAKNMVFPEAVGTKLRSGKT